MAINLKSLSKPTGQRPIIATLFGEGGMGKTTLLKALIGILDSDKGSINLDGEELVKQPSFKRVQSGLAYVPQGRMIFPSMTVSDNIRAGMEKSKSKTIPDYVYEIFPVLKEMGERKGGNPELSQGWTPSRDDHWGSRSNWESHCR